MRASIDDGVHVFEISPRSTAVIKQRLNIPLVTIAIAARGGSHNETRERAGLTGLMARTSIKGTSSRTAAQIAETAETMGGSVSPAVSADMLDWQITVPAKHFERALELLADVAFNASFPGDEFEIERKLALADIEQMRDDMYRYPTRLCLQLAFRGHPYGNAMHDVESAMVAATSGTLAAWYAAEMLTAPWAFIVGNVDPDTAARSVSRFMRTSEATPRTGPPRVEWTGGATDVETRDKAQTALAIAFPGPDRNHPDVFALHVLANAAGGLGGRFFEELRSKRSLAYTVSLMPVARWLGGAFLAYIATAPEREAEARDGLFEQFERLVSDPLSPAEIGRAQRYTIGTWQIRSQTNGSQLADLMHAYLLGPGAMEIKEFEERVRSVTAEDVVRVAQKYFDPGLAAQGIVRGQKP